MTLHRFAEQMDTIFPAAAADQAPGFVACPLVCTGSPAEQARIAQVYRLAAERTREQLRPITYPQFSMN